MIIIEIIGRSFLGVEGGVETLQCTYFFCESGGGEETWLEYLCVLRRWKAGEREELAVGIPRIEM